MLLVNFLCHCAFLLSVLPQIINAFADWSNEMDPAKWNREAKEALDNILNRQANTNLAKNIIIFLGDGMGPSSVTAGRIRKGQKKGSIQAKALLFIIYM